MSFPCLHPCGSPDLTANRPLIPSRGRSGPGRNVRCSAAAGAVAVDLRLAIALRGPQPGVFACAPLQNDFLTASRLS